MTRLLLAMALIIVLALVPFSRRQDGLRVGSKKFTESVILGDMAAQLLRDEGLEALHLRELGGTRLVFDALVAGEIDLIDSVSYADAADFRKQYKGTFNSWEVQQVGCGWVGFNLKNGPFSYQNPNGHLLRQAAAHAVDQAAPSSDVAAPAGAGRSPSRKRLVIVSVRLSRFPKSFARSAL